MIRDFTPIIEAQKPDFEQRMVRALNSTAFAWCLIILSVFVVCVSSVALAYFNLSSGR